MDKLFGLAVDDDDDLFARAEAEGQAFEGTGVDAEDDAFGWLAELSRDPGCWPRCACETRCGGCPDHRFVRSAGGGLAIQSIDPRNGRPRPPDWERLRWEAIEFKARHDQATTWLFSHQTHWQPPVPLDLGL